MLSEILFASVEPQVDTSRAPGISCSQLFPCPYRLYLVHTGQAIQEKPDARSLLNMQDGWDQEEQSVRRLAKAGIRIESRGPGQRGVVVGRSDIPGSIDGIVTLQSERMLWEHKAWNDRGFEDFSTYGLSHHTGERCQINAYMLGKGLTKCSFFVKGKNNNDYSDILVTLDEEFIGPVLEWADRIRLEGWKPEPEERPECTYCGVGCFGPRLDFSWIGTVSEDEMVEKWRKGRSFRDIGDMLMDEARTYFVGKEDRYGAKIVEGIIGDKDLLIVGDLEIKKVNRHEFKVDKTKILKEYGPEGLLKVGEDVFSSYYRFNLKE